MKRLFAATAMTATLTITACATDPHEQEMRAYPATLQALQDEGLSLDSENALRICDLKREKKTDDEIVASFSPVDPDGLKRAIRVVDERMCV